MCKQTYNAMNEKLLPTPQLMEDTLEKMEARRARRRRPIGPRRIAAAGAAAALVVCASLTAVAAVPRLGQFWEELTARYGGHVQMVEPEATAAPAPAENGEPEATNGPAPAENGGPQLQVAAAALDRDNAEIYFTLTGLEGPQEDEVLAVGELRVGGQAVPVSAKPVYYDQEAGTMVFAQDIYVPDGIEGSEASLAIKGVYTRAAFDGDPEAGQGHFSLALDGLALDQDPATLTYTMEDEEEKLAQSWQARYDTIAQNGVVTLLAPGDDKAIPGVEGVCISAAGYVDGRLHVQLHVKDPAVSALLLSSMMCSDPNFEPNGGQYDDRTFDVPFHLADGQVTGIYDPHRSNGSQSAIDAKMGYEYVEIISGLPQEVLGDWQWGFDLVTGSVVLEGDWQQSFTLSGGGLAMRQNQEPFTVDVETLHLPENPGEEDFASTWAPAAFDGLRVTPFGVTVSRAARAEDEAPQQDGILKRFAPDVSKLEITIETAEGTQACTLDEDGYTILPENGRMSARYLLEKPVEPEEIISLQVNGVEIALG